jgi:hypothetical protein
MADFQLTKGLFDPPVSMDAALEEMERAQEELRSITHDINSGNIRDSMPPREYRPWREQKIAEQQRLSERYRYVKKWVGTQKRAIYEAMQRTNGLEPGDPLSLIKNARKIIARLHKEHDIPFSPDTQVLLDALKDYIESGINSATR